MFSPPVAVRAAAALASAVLLVSAPRALAQHPVKRLQLEQYLDMETVSGPIFSPDGKQILYTRGYVDKMTDSKVSALWMMNNDGTHDRFLVKGGSPKWSPDGTRLAYVATPEGGGAGAPAVAQIFVRWMDSEGGTSQTTHLTEAPS